MPKISEFFTDSEFIKNMKNKGILAGLKLDENKVLVTATEMNSEEEIEDYANRI